MVIHVMDDHQINKEAGEEGGLSWQWSLVVRSVLQSQGSVIDLLIVSYHSFE